MARPSSLGNPGIKDLGHVLRGILKLSAKRKGRGDRGIDRRERSTIMASNRVPPLREASKVIVVNLDPENNFYRDIKTIS